MERGREATEVISSDRPVWPVTRTQGILRLLLPPEPCVNAFSVDAWITLAVLASILLLLIFNVASAEIVVLVGLAVLLFTGVLSTDEALSGFANEGMMTVAVLYVVVAALRETGVMGWVAQRVFGQPRSVPIAQLRMMLPIAPLSALKLSRK